MSWERNTVILGIYAKIMNEFEVKDEFKEKMLRSLNDLISDLNTRFSSSFMARSSYIIAFQGMKGVSHVVNSYYQTYPIPCIAIIEQLNLFDS